MTRPARLQEAEEYWTWNSASTNFTGGLIPTVIAVLLAGWMVVRAWRLRKRLRARREQA